MTKMISKVNQKFNFFLVSNMAPCGIYKARNSACFQGKWPCKPSAVIYHIYYWILLEYFIGEGIGKTGTANGYKAYVVTISDFSWFSEFL
jgi:hypothetical protein